MTAKTLMLQGASSSVGKSWLVAALCRIFARQGVRVAPFKAQNMSNNAAVCADGSEIGRAQAVQAFAAGIEPTADMNPLLLKPEADARSQVVLLGRPWKTVSAGTFYRYKAQLWPRVTAALDRLRAEYDLVLLEGAGSAAELNLKDGDLVNMAVARHAASPVLLVGDIDRGGIFAQLLGTLWLLEAEERELVRGFLVNKFRGDLSLFADGVRILEERGGLPVLGVIPYLHDHGIPEEDAVALETLRASSPTAKRAGEVDIAVISFPRIANFDDFDPLRAEPGVRVRYVTSVEELGQPSAVILPGSKSTIADLTWLRDRGFEETIRGLTERGTAIVGICGGYQMLGRTILDPDHTESLVERLPGLGLLPLETTFVTVKATHRAVARLRGGPGWLAGLDGQVAEGYEIHMGRTEGGAPWLEITVQSGKPVSAPDGACSADGCVWGCYLHGLFENEPVRRAWLDSLSWNAGSASGTTGGLTAAIDRLADHVEAALDMDRLRAIIEG